MKAGSENYLNLAREFMEAVKAGDPDRLSRLYAEDIAVWHSFDKKKQTKSENIRTLIWMYKNVKGIQYKDIEVAATDNGFVQQHVMSADSPKFSVPCMLRAWCDGGRITRIDEYLDSKDVVALTNHIATYKSSK